jgi:putative CocE/NonD family hydrolase
MTSAAPPVVQTNLETRLRDGVILRGDLYHPEGDDRRPVLLERTPYGKGAGNAPSRFVQKALDRGYAVFVQDVRGRYASDGVFDPYRQEGRDGYDTVEWIAAQPWSNGKIGTYGLSYPGATQWLLAVEDPPHLTCIFPSMTFSSAREFFYFGGAFDLSWLPYLIQNIAPDIRRRMNLPVPAGNADRTGRDAAAKAALWHVPLNDVPDLKDSCPFYFEWLDHPDDGDYWDYANIEARYDKLRVPAFNFSGWHDEGYGPNGAVRNFVGARRKGATAAARQPRLLIGPWTHGGQSRSKFGDRDFGADAAIQYDELVLNWNDLHLRGVDTSGFAAEPPVKVFTMGTNRWRTANAWPIPETRYHSWYLHAGGKLATAIPAVTETPSTYVYDPNDPVVDPHGGAYAGVLGPFDQQQVGTRKDVLVFESEPLDGNLEVTGNIEIHLWISSSAPDTDFHVHVLDVEPDGRAWNLMSPTVEVIRARYRNDERRPELMTAGQPCELTLKLPITSNCFLKGHRIRAHVMSSFFPHLDRNPNTGRPISAEGRLVAARQTVYHDARRPSRLILPIVRE